MSQPSEAADLVATAERLQRAVRDGASWVYVSWLAGLAVANTMYLTGLGVAGHHDPSVLVVSLAFGVCVAGLSLGLLPRARVSSAGFPRRLAAAMVGWAVVFAVLITVGLLFFRGELAFWLPAAVVVALPLVLGVRAEITA